MTSWTLIRRSLRFYARSHLAVLLGATVASAVLIGALTVGDSVRGSLRDLALARLGRIEWAIASPDRFFRAQLADDLAAQPESESPGTRTLNSGLVPAVELVATANRADGAARANRVQFLGIDERFWQLAPGGSPPFTSETGLSRDEVAVNERLAAQLRVRAGDTIVFRLPKPSGLSRDAPISPQADASAALRLTVKTILTDHEFGRFSLQANQVPPFNAFASLSRLQEALGLQGRANLLLVGRERGQDALTVTRRRLRLDDRMRAPLGILAVEQERLALEAATESLTQAWQLADAELELRELPHAGAIELRTRRVFLDPPVAEAGLKIVPGATGILTYLVNELRVGNRTTCYSMVTAMGAPLVPPDMRDDEILINQWLADDLGTKPGDELKLTCYVLGETRRLEERSNSFRVRAILPLTGPAADPDLMPDFPGIAKASNCRDWDAGFAIDTGRIRDKDEQYWRDFRGTPKAFVTLAAGQWMWKNRFGNLTAVRYPRAGNSVDGLAKTLRAALNPAWFGLSLQPVRQQALAAANQSQDFGGLFLGFSFFLIIAALLLMGLLFQFGIEQRAAEVGTLLALGFKPHQVRRLLLGEGFTVSILGAVIGLFAGSCYARAMLKGLTTIWKDAVGTQSLTFHAEPLTLFTGAVASVLVAGLTIWLTLRKQARRPARALLAEGGEDASPGLVERKRVGRRGLYLPAGATLAALLLIGWALLRKDTASAEAFFGAGALLLLGILGFCSTLLAALAHLDRGGEISFSSVGIRNLARRRRRSLATVGLLACGSFLIVAVGANRLDATRDATRRSSGTGGFVLLGESALPVNQDLSSKAGREFFGLDDRLMEGVQIVPLRVRDGDDASCLNLNRAQKPRLLGVNPELLASRGVFTFAQLEKGSSATNGWTLLSSPHDAAFRQAHSEIANRQSPIANPDEIPAIGDAASIQWALGKKVGDTLGYTDEHGQEFKVRIVGAVQNSILQGNLLISEHAFVARFPSESGYRMFLIDTPSNRAADVSAHLSRALGDLGLELTPTTRRLAEFNAVQNTYLSTFQVLGGLGLLLGSIGLGVVVLRNVMERRGELALLLAVGFRRRALRWLVLCEHAALLVLGLAVGVGAAAAAVFPALLSQRGEFPAISLGFTLLAVLLNGAVWTWLATAVALRGRIIEALRNE